MHTPARPSDQGGSSSNSGSDEAARAARLVSRANHKPVAPQAGHAPAAPRSESLHAQPSAPAQPPAAVARPQAPASHASHAPHAQAAPQRPSAPQPAAPAPKRGLAGATHPGPAPLPPSLYAAAPVGEPTRPAPRTTSGAYVTPSSRVVIPSWLQPFTMPPNTRFTRTPDYLLRQPPVPEPAAPEPVSVVVAENLAAAQAAVAPRPSPPALRVPPRKPPRGPAAPMVLAPATPNAALNRPQADDAEAQSIAAEPAPVAAPLPPAAVTLAPVTPEVAPVAAMPSAAAPAVAAPVDVPVAGPVDAPAAAVPRPFAVPARAVPVSTVPPSTIQRIAGLIQLGWVEPPVPADQDFITPLAVDDAAAQPDVTADEVVIETAIAASGTALDEAAEAAFAEEPAAEAPFIAAPLAAPLHDEDDAFFAEDAPVLAEPTSEEPDEAIIETVAAFAVDDDMICDDAMVVAESLIVAEEMIIVEEEPAADLYPAVAEAPAEDFAAVFEAPYLLGGAAVTFSWPVFGIATAAAPVAAPAPVAQEAAQVAAPQMVAPHAVAPAIPAPVAAPVAPARYGYDLPPLELLTEPPQSEPDYELSEEFLERNSVKLQQVLHDFGVRGEIIDANPGPVVTLYELEPAPGIKSSRVIGLSADIARSMSAVSARVAVVEGRNVIGIELPNQRRETVWLREMLSSHEFEAAKAKLGIGLGKTIGGEPVIVDLARMPHLLVAGTTGSGKSVAINTMILSLLYRHRPDQCRLIMIDPKMLELSVYEGIPHLLTPVVTDPKKAIVALKWAVREMEERYKKMSRLGVRNIDGFNARVVEAAAKGEIITRTVQKGFDRETGEMMEEEEIMDLSPLPFIVIVVDEMADLMMVAGKDIEGAIQRLAQMARAAGIHLIMATQRPSVDVITGTIKANFPTRISFQVTSKIDSRTILGEMGAEQLLGQGDMLYMAGGGRISRVHGPFVSDQEVERVVEHLKAQGRPDYLDAVTAEDDEEAPAPAMVEDDAVFDKTGMGAEPGELYDQAVSVVMRDRKASTSYIQRRLQIGYNRAASIMERMENEGLVGPANHAGKREILMENRPAR